MAESVYTFVAGDTGSILRVSLIDDDAATAIDLTGATVLLQWKSPASGALVSKTMTINSPASAGVVQYQFAAAEIEAPSMAFEVKVTDSGSKVTRTLELLTERVRSALA